VGDFSEIDIEIEEAIEDGKARELSREMIDKKEYKKLAEFFKKTLKGENNK